MTSAAPAEVQFVGTDTAAADIRKWADQLAPEIVKAAGPFAERIADSVRGRVPVLTGTLASSVTTSEEEDGVGVGYDGEAPYDAWIEFGGSRGRAYIPEGRYLYPTAQEAEEEFATLASDAASDSAGRFPWTAPAH